MATQLPDLPARIRALVDQADNAIDEMISRPRILESTQTEAEADRLFKIIDGSDHDLRAQKIWDHCTFKWGA